MAGLSVHSLTAQRAMKTIFFFLALLFAAFALIGCAATPKHNPEVTSSESQATLPPLPSGVTELKFNEFFVTPVGPLGLELWKRLVRHHQLNRLARRSAGEAAWRHAHDRQRGSERWSSAI